MIKVCMVHVGMLHVGMSYVYGLQTCKPATCHLPPATCYNSRIMRTYGIVILTTLLISIYTLTSAGKFHIVDEVSLFAVTESLALRREIDTNAIAWTQWVNSPGEVLGAFGSQDEVYSKKGPAPAFLAVPWYWLLQALNRVGFHFGMLQATLLWNGIVTAATAALLWLTVERLGYRRIIGLQLALLYGLCTIAWPYANHFFGEPLSALSLLLTFYGLLSWKKSGQHLRHEGINCALPKKYGTRTRADENGFREDIRVGEVPALRISTLVRAPFLPLKSSTYGLTQYRWLWLAGMGAGLAIATVTAHLILIAILGIYFLYLCISLKNSRSSAFIRVPSKSSQPDIPPKMDGLQISENPRSSAFIRVLSSFLIPIFISVLLLISYNYIRFSALFETGYHFATGEGFTTPILEGAWGLLFSPYRSLFLHTPLFILLPLTLILFIRHHRAAGLTILALTTALITLYSLWWMWWGGFAWGPRFLVPLTPLWILTFAPLLGGGSETDEPETEFFRKNSVSKLLLWLLTLISFTVQLSAVSLNYINYEIILRSIFPTDWADPLAYGPPAQSMSDFLHSPVFGQIHLLRENLQANLDLAWVWRVEQGLHIEWPVVWMAIVTLSIPLLALVNYARCTHLKCMASFFLKIGWLTPLLTCALMITWAQAASQNPHYGQPEQGYRAVLAEICQQEARLHTDSVIITVAPTVYQIAMNWLPTHCDQPPPIYGHATTSAEHPEAQRKLAMLMEQYERVWFVTGGLPPHDPNNSVERWLAENGYQAAAAWYDDYRLLQYGSGLALGSVEPTEINMTLHDPTEIDSFQIIIQGVRLPAQAEIGAILPIEIVYQANDAPRPDLRWFIQLWNEAGAPVAFLDSAPLDGYSAFSRLESGQMYLEKAGLVIPPDTAVGNYRVIGGLYNPSAEGRRLQSSDKADFIELGQIRVD